MNLGYNFVMGCLLTLVSGFLAYHWLKTGVIFDKFGRIAAKRDVSPLIFWTLWSPAALVAVCGSGCLLWILFMELFG